MTEHNSVRRKAERFGDNGWGRHRTKLAVDQAYDVSVVDQRPADREQAQRRQMIVGNSAADRRMRHVDEENTHEPALSPCSEARERFKRQRLQAAEAALAPMKRRQCLSEILGLEFRP